jgi:hypothetical protein
MNVTGPSRKAQESAVLDIGSRLELFVDRYLIDRLRDARLKLHPPTQTSMRSASDRKPREE